MAKRRPSGDGMVRKREDGRWEGRIVVGHKENGDSIFRYVYADTQKELTAKLRQHIDIYQGVDLTEQSRMTLAEWLDQWLENIAGTIRPTTLARYQGAVRIHIDPHLGSKSITQVTGKDVQKLYDALASHGNQITGKGLASSTIRGIHSMLHEALDAAKQAGLIPWNPTEEISTPKFTCKSKQILTDEQLDTFMEAIQKDDIWHDFFYMELTTGLRRGEICGLMWQDFDEAHGTLTVRRTIHAERGGRLTAGETKTGAGKRIITLPPSTAQLLSERRKQTYSEWIFPDPLRPERPTRPDAAYVRMKELLKKAGLPSIRFHDLRHPYVKHTTKIFSLRSMAFQAQAYPDARRKTRGACQLHRGGQSQSPVRPLCNRKRFS
ncbi:tyrosine-type recombinase/integrase [Dysosmobacter welbionis]|uniref:tyrosine-type recombinase/integrase n=1 Tax=Dysosmobacter welbionis TaxID=2093857 RepID=UPI003A94A98A